MPIESLTDGQDVFRFNILSDQDDELTSSSKKNLMIKVYSLYSLDKERQDFIEEIKMETQANKNLITLIPDNREFATIDKLVGDVSRYQYMEQKYAGETDQSKRQIVRDFGTIREEKEKILRYKIEAAYQNASLIYLFDETRLTPESPPAAE